MLESERCWRRTEGRKNVEKATQPEPMFVRNIKKSQYDECEYGGVTLPNGLRAVVVSDQTISEAAVCLDVRIGSSLQLF